MVLANNPNLPANKISANNKLQNSLEYRYTLNEISFHETKTNHTKCGTNISRSAILGNVLKLFDHFFYPKLPV